MPVAPGADRSNVSRTFVALVLLVVVLSGAVRFVNLSLYPRLIFDEHFYVHDANSVLHGRIGPRRPQPWMPGDETGLAHPPLGTLSIAAGILALGNDPWGWRVPSAIAGTLLIALVYPLARRLHLSPLWALVAVVLAASDTMLVVESRIGVLDPFVALWTGVCIYCALRYVQSGGPLRWLLLTGVSGGLAIASKWSGGLALVAALVIVAVNWVGKRQGGRPMVTQRQGRIDGGTAAANVHEGGCAGDSGKRDGVAANLAKAAACLVALPFLVYVASYADYFASGHSVYQWLQLHVHMARYNWSALGPQDIISRPYTWIFDVRPIWYEWAPTLHGVVGLIAIGNPVLLWVSIPAFVGLLWLAVRRRDPTLAGAPLLVGILYLPWLATTRASYIYYLTPVVPFLAIMVATAFARLAGSASLGARWTVALFAAGAATMGAAAGGTLAVRLVALAALAAVVSAAIVVRPGRKGERAGTAAVAVWLCTGAVVGMAIAWLPFLIYQASSIGYYERVTWFSTWR
jgi:dolichyl-phosphate-mannose--protein O-mannosyl transferase